MKRRDSDDDYEQKALAEKKKLHAAATRRYECVSECSSSALCSLLTRTCACRSKKKVAAPKIKATARKQGKSNFQGR
jgi:hypothetical protein